MDELKKVLKKVLKYNYSNFNGRADRSEFWLFTFLAYMYMMVALFIAYFIIVIVAISIAAGGHQSEGGIAIMMMLAIYGVMFLSILPILIPLLAITARRLHDTDRSGWWMLLGFVPFGGIVLYFFLVQQGSKGANQYGEDPRIGEYTEYLNSLYNRQV